MITTKICFERSCSLLKDKGIKIVIQKYDPAGELLWVNEIDDLLDTSYTPKAITVVKNAYVYVAYYKEYNYPEEGEDVIETESKACVNAYSLDGDLIWEKTLDENSSHRFFKI